MTRSNLKNPMNSPILQRHKRNLRFRKSSKRSRLGGERILIQTILSFKDCFRVRRNILLVENKETKGAYFIQKRWNANAEEPSMSRLLCNSSDLATEFLKGDLRMLSRWAKNWRITRLIKIFSRSKTIAPFRLNYDSLKSPTRAPSRNPMSSK